MSAYCRICGAKDVEVGSRYCIKCETALQTTPKPITRASMFSSTNRRRTRRDHVGDTVRHLGGLAKFFVIGHIVVGVLTGAGAWLFARIMRG